MAEVVVNGRKVDNTCPFAGDCWVNQGCYPFGPCPPTPYTTLQRSAELEHELGLIPHTDPDLTAVCPVCGRSR